jgi:hypothetical protein
MFSVIQPERTLAFSAGNLVPGDLARGGIVRELACQLTATPTVAGAANTAAAVRRGGVWGAISRLEVVVNSSEFLVSLPGYALPFLQFMWTGRMPRQTPTDSITVSTLGDAATANPPLDSTVYLPFTQPLSAKSLDTALDVRRALAFEIRATWGLATAADISSGATAYTANPSLETTVNRSYPTDEQVPPDAILTEWRRNFTQFALPATTAAQRIDLIRGYAYRGLIIETHNNGAQAASIMNKIAIKSGATVFASMRAEPMKDFFRSRYNLNENSVPVEYARGQNTLAGWYLLDFLQDGRLSETIDTAGLAEFYAELDVIGGANINAVFYPWYFSPPRVAA